ncbi:MAG: tautomerase family protein [Thermoleophilaceae bacterium]|jgi:4-oxalocrotonate tautomerase|nr:tautomerase family protein [Thermoleophilaceae bacterium]
MPFVTIEWFEGRSDEQKRAIAERVTNALAEVGEVPADQVWIRFVDASRADWAIGGEIQGERPSDSDPALGPPD